MPLAEYVSLLRYCEVLPDAFPLALSSSHSYRFSFNWVVSNYTVTYPKVSYAYCVARVCVHATLSP